MIQGDYKLKTMLSKIGICSGMKEVEGEGFTSMISLTKRNIPFVQIFAKNAFKFSCLYSILQHTQIKTSKFIAVM